MEGPEPVWFSLLPILMQKSFWCQQCSIWHSVPSPTSWDLSHQQYLSGGNSALNKVNKWTNWLGQVWARARRVSTGQWILLVISCWTVLLFICVVKGKATTVYRLLLWLTLVVVWCLLTTNWSQLHASEQLLSCQDSVWCLGHTLWLWRHTSVVSWCFDFEPSQRRIPQ